jgi:hypothetical protein
MEGNEGRFSTEEQEGRRDSKQEITRSGVIEWS